MKENIFTHKNLHWRYNYYTESDAQIYVKFRQNIVI